MNGNGKKGAIATGTLVGIGITFLLGSVGWFGSGMINGNTDRKEIRAESSKRDERIAVVETEIAIWKETLARIEFKLDAVISEKAYGDD